MSAWYTAVPKKRLAEIVAQVAKHAHVILRQDGVYICQWCGVEERSNRIDHEYWCLWEELQKLVGPKEHGR